jgi:hypothetical protein
LLGKPFNMACLTMAEVVAGQVVFAYNFVSFNQPRTSLPGWSPMPSLNYLNSLPPVALDAGSADPCGAVESMIRGAWGGNPGILPSCVESGVNVIEANAYGMQTRGLEGLQRNAEWFAAQIPRPSIRVLRSLTEGPTAAVVFEVGGQVEGSGFGTVARGSHVTAKGMVLGTARGQKLCHAYSHLDFNHIGEELPAP